MITVEQLEARGYRHFEHGLHRRRDGYLGIWQKAVADSNDILYHITLDAWDHERLGVAPGIRFAPKVQLQTTDGLRSVFNCEMILGDETIEQVEAFFARLWVTMAAARHGKDG